MTDRTDPYEIIGVRRDASLAEIRISYRRSTQILAPERFASASETVRSEAARRLAALNGAMETIEAERAAESGSALGSLSFGGPAVSSAAEPSLRSTVVVDEPPPLAPPAAEPELERIDNNIEAPEVIHLTPAPPVEEAAPPEPEAPAEPEAEAAAETEPEAEAGPDEPVAAAAPPVAEEPAGAVVLETVEEEPVAPVAAEPEAPVAEESAAPVTPPAEPVAEEPEPPVADDPTVEEAAAVTTADTEGGLPALTGEDTAEVPIVAEPEAEPASEAEPAPELVPVAMAAPAPPPRRPERDRGTSGSDTRERSILPRVLAAGAVVLALAAVGVYFLVGNGSSGGDSSGGQFQSATAPVSFTYPDDLVTRKPPQGGLLKPTFSTAVGLDASNYVVVATYRISADVQADGSAVGTGGTRLTADRFDQSVDRAAERIAAAQKLKAKGPVQPGKAGDLIARVYTYTRPGGNTALYAFAFRGHTEYSVACFWDPTHAETMQAACQQVMTSLQRTSA